MESNIDDYITDKIPSWETEELSYPGEEFDKDGDLYMYEYKTDITKSDF